mmetsp:Transcript_26596/g.43522  ORF Transcript_26596/g.43522 Transcript_26596/m.43522 type:complete len:390 (-) Transcript_26596:312-1481(-)|eukprot:CAMPEP_0184671914 /NCGR_PEP_ID=MMETSP0308-20130426/85787_1 /TAXON_ID=38269 /ORGANISM="Gloeochaete witrockiana, Strain SAG 46.84" /LENGTH=389 /DNA_ID=CAMNT_0027119137 /DNA_START=136 /DNA_END=1305 /DNA_ORIENTATION=+
MGSCASTYGSTSPQYGDQRGSLPSNPNFLHVIEDAVEVDKKPGTSSFFGLDEAARMGSDVGDKYDIDNNFIVSDAGELLKIGIEKTTGKKWAIRQVPANTHLKQVMREVRIIKQAQGHPMIGRLNEVIRTAADVYIIVEPALSRSVLDQLALRGSYTELDLSEILRRIASMLSHLHSKGIVLGSLEASKLVEVSGSASDRPDLKVFDFKSAIFTGSPESTSSYRWLGTPEYAAPEVLSEKRFSSSCDLWSLGVIGYVLLCGYFPFVADNLKDLLNLVSIGKVEFPAQEWDLVSSSAKDLIQQLLCSDPLKRPSADKCVSHPWVQGKTALNVPLSATSIQNLSRLASLQRQSNSKEFPIDTDINGIREEVLKWQKSIGSADLGLSHLQLA